MRYNHEEMQSAVKDLAMDFPPECELSFGYIGNLEFGRDYRSWYIFTQCKDKRWSRLSYPIRVEENYIFRLDKDKFKMWLEKNSYHPTLAVQCTSCCGKGYTLVNKKDSDQPTGEM